MNRLPLSHSGISQFEACPLRFKSERIDKIKGTPSLPMVKGSFAHEVTDQYFKHLVKSGQPSDFKMIESLAHIAWINRGNSPEWGLIPEADFDEMMGLFYAIREDCIIDPKRVVASEQGASFNEKWEPVGWDHKDVFFRARIDRLELGDDLVAKVWDLKTGRRIDRDANTPQMRRYAFVTSLILPEAVKIEAELYYPRKRAAYSVAFAPGEVAGVKDEIVRVSDQVEAMRAKGVWPAKPNFLACRDCPVFARCPEKVALEGKAKPARSRGEADRLVQKWLMLNRDLDETKALLKEYVDMSGGVQTSGMIADYSVSHRLSWDTERLYKVLEGEGLNPLRFLRGDPTAISKEVGKNAKLKAQLEPITKDKASTSFTLKRCDDEDDE